MSSEYRIHWISSPLGSTDGSTIRTPALATDFIGEFEQDAVIDGNHIVQVTAERKSQVLPVLEGHVAFPLADWVAVAPFRRGRVAVLRPLSRPPCLLSLYLFLVALDRSFPRWKYFVKAAMKVGGQLHNEVHREVC